MPFYLYMYNSWLLVVLHMLCYVMLRYITCSTQQEVGTPSGAYEMLIGGRAL
jgi:hypothetical protein